MRIDHEIINIKAFYGTNNYATPKLGDEAKRTDVIDSLIKAIVRCAIVIEYRSSVIRLFLLIKIKHWVKSKTSVGNIKDLPD